MLETAPGASAPLVDARRDRPPRPPADDRARIGAWWALLLAGFLAIWVVAIGNGWAIVVIAPALLGGAIGVRARDRIALLAAAALVAVTATLLLIGWVGFLFLPPVGLLASAALARDGGATRGRE